MDRERGRTRKAGARRTSVRTGAVGALGVAVMLLTATSAFAKGSADLTVSPGTVRVGQTVHITGHGDSDSAGHARFCAQERTGTKGAWHNVGCGSIVDIQTKDATVDVRTKAGQRGVLEFRGVLFRVDGPNGGHPRQDFTSVTRTVHVR